MMYLLTNLVLVFGVTHIGAITPAREHLQEASVSTIEVTVPLCVSPVPTVILPTPAEVPPRVGCVVTRWEYVLFGLTLIAPWVEALSGFT